MRGRRPWRRCSSCWGICHWHDEAWVCDECGDEWYPDHDPKRYGAPGDTKEKRVKKTKAVAGIVAIAGALTLTGCMDKATEPFKDAGVSERDNGKAGIGTMPDGFSNYAYKCVPGSHTLVVTAYKADDNRASLSTTLDPEKCP